MGKCSIGVFLDKSHPSGGFLSPPHIATIVDAEVIFVDLFFDVCAILAKCLDVPTLAKM
jgi:hypothetical protein